MEDFVIIPSREKDYAFLSRSAQGRIFRKHILNKGELIHPASGRKIQVDDAFVASLKSNFENKVCDIVQVPLANDKNQHTEDPSRNLGEVIDVQEENGKVYAVLDIRDADAASKMGKTYLGASAMLSLDYTNTATGEKVGPTLLHSCVTNRPYVIGLEDYEEIVAATSDSSSDAATLLFEDTEPEFEPEVVPTQEEIVPTLEEIIEQLKTEHNIDVLALQTQAAEAESATSLSQTLVEALKDTGLVQLSASDEEISTEDVIGAVAELATGYVSLSGQVGALNKRDAEHAVDKLVATGYVIPAQRDTYVEIRLSSPETFDKLIPATPIIRMNKETGVGPDEEATKRQSHEDEVARLTSDGSNSHLFTGKKN